MLGERERVAFPLSPSRPATASAMRERAIRVGEPGIRSLGDEGVAKDELVLAGEARGRASGDDLAPGQVVELVRRGLPRFGARRSSGLGVGQRAEDRVDAAPPEDVAEDARSAEEPLGARPERVEPRLHHPEHGVGELGEISVVGDRADELTRGRRRCRRRALDDAS